MISSEVQRTLVKSPPELWAEISDPESLGRHLGEFGEIRITRVHPEQKVEWEGENASGTVVIKPSGWGTKVKLTVTRELSREPGGDVDAAPESDAEPEPAAKAEPAVEHELAVEVEPAVDAELAGELAVEAEPSLDVEEEPAAEPTPEPEDELPVQPARRRGLFTRLFGRRRSAPAASAEREPAPDPEPAPGPVLAVGSEPLPVDTLTSSAEPAPRAERDERPDEADEGEDDERRSDIAAELAAAEEVAAEQVTAVLTSVLDRLGAAHHRPFSRS